MGGPVEEVEKQVRHERVEAERALRRPPVADRSLGDAAALLHSLDVTSERCSEAACRAAAPMGAPPAVDQHVERPSLSLGSARPLPSGQRAAQILARVRAIPPGFVRTYRDVDPKAPRLVGHVLATTHERVPWHRVVRADGSVPMGDAQRARLRREGVPLNGGRVDLARARMAG